MNIVIDQRFVIAPAGTFRGIDTNLPYAGVGRAANGSLYMIAANNTLYVSHDDGHTWSGQPLPPWKACWGSFGIVGDDRLVVLHSDVEGRENHIGVSTSDDYGKTWDTRSIDMRAVRPAGTPEGHRYHVTHPSLGTVFETADGAICAGVAFHPSGGIAANWPPVVPFGEGLIRSRDGGKTWGDANLLHRADACHHECDYAVDPRNADHVFCIARHQRPQLPGEDAAEAQALVGFPDDTEFFRKNGQLLESTDGGRTFEFTRNGTLKWYQHRNSIAWSQAGIVAVTHSGGPYRYSPQGGEVHVRISPDHGRTWFDGSPEGADGIGADGVRAFVLHRPDIFEDGRAHNAVGDTSTAVLDDTRFFTTMEAFIDAEYGTDKVELLGVRWHVEGDLVE